MLLTDDVIERLYSKIDRTGNGCHEWLAGKDGSGYGALGIDDKKYSAHRLVLEIKQPGFMESGLHALHTCDNPGCCNPNHLWSGTAKENAQDKVAKGRDLPNRIALTGHQWNRGSKHGRSKLVESDVLKIIELFNQGTTTIEIAAMFNVSQSTINNIKAGRRWAQPIDGIISTMIDSMNQMGILKP